MISFTGLSILIGAIAGFTAGVMVSLYNRKAVITTATSVAVFALAFGLSQTFMAPTYEIWNLRSEINKVPIMEAIKKYHSQEYAALIEKADNSIKFKEQSQDMIGYAYFVANEIFMSDLKQAPNKAIYDYLQAIEKIYVFLYQTNPESIIKLESADLSVTLDLATLLTNPDFKKLFDSTLTAKKEVIRAAVKEPVPLANKAIAHSMLEDILKQLRDKYGATEVNLALNVRGTQLDPRKEAQIIVNFYQSLINLGEAKAGTVMRYIGLLADEQNARQ